MRRSGTTRRGRAAPDSAVGVSGGAIGGAAALGGEDMTDDRDDRELDAYSQVVTGVAAALRPCVVSVRVRSGRGEGSGSAVLFTDDGFLLTSAHVVEGASGGGLTAADGEESPFDVVGTDRLSELAVLRTRPGLAPAAVLGDADRL